MKVTQRLGLCLTRTRSVLISLVKVRNSQLLRRQVISVFYVEKLLTFVISLKEVQRAKVLKTGSLIICIALLRMQDAVAVTMLLIFVRLLYRKFHLDCRPFTSNNAHSSSH